MTTRKGLKRKQHAKKPIGLLAVFAAMLAYCADAANPFLPLWEYIPDGEPYVFDDPDNPGKKRVYLYGSHDTRISDYCGRDQVVWSAPVEDLNAWRFDGVAFRSLLDGHGRPLGKDGLGDILYAPEVAEVVGAGGKKSYYFYPNTQGRGRRNMVAKSDRPDGPFTVCNWDANEPWKTVGPVDFDPGILVDDDGRVYAYWGNTRSFAAELDPATMSTIKPGTQVVSDMVSGCRQPGVFRFFEASSIRKIKGKYVFIYSRWAQDGEFGLENSNYTLAYAYSDKPLGPWTYGGTIIDGRARETASDGSARITATPGGNTHGSLCEINGKWYLFYHRQTGKDQFSRQAMVARVDVSVEEGPGGKVAISEGEVDSMGFEANGLDPFALHAAGIACYYTGPTPAGRVPGRSVVRGFIFSGPYPAPHRCDGYTVRHAYGPNVNRCALVNCTEGSVVGWKYFNFDKTHVKKGLKLLLEMEAYGIPGVIDVWAIRPTAEEGGIKVGSFKILEDAPSQIHTVEIPVDAIGDMKGREALFLAFSSPVKGKSMCTLHTLRFK